MEWMSLIEESWAPQQEALLRKIAENLQALRDSLSVEEAKLSNGNANQATRQLQGYGAGILDTQAFASIVSKKKVLGKLDAGALERIQKLVHGLQKWQSDFISQIPPCHMESMGELSILEDAAKKHLNQMAEVFALLRKAGLERQTRYEPTVHDAFFADFTWEHLTNAEVALCPPFVVSVEDSGNRDVYFSRILPLLTSGLPIKVLLLRRGFRNPSHGFGRSAAMRTSLEVEMLPIALKNVYVIQDALARKESHVAIRKALRSPRPALLSIYVELDAIRTSQAIASRALPVFRYNPDEETAFLKRFDLSGNPSLQTAWTERSVEHMDSLGVKDRTTLSYTFADFAAGEAEYTAEFRDLPADAHKVALSDYLEMDAQSRMGRIPFISVLDAQGRLVQKAVSMQVVQQSDSKRHIWEALCEVAGSRNPFLQEFEKGLRAQFDLQLRDALARQKQELEQAAAQSREEAVEVALRRVAERLLGKESAVTTTVVTSKVKTISAPVAAPKSAPKSAEQTGPWIESSSCTACDECIRIDSGIFAYNANKQAYIKDPNGGPRKNLLKAAQKCSAQIIHPGE